MSELIGVRGKQNDKLAGAIVIVTIRIDFSYSSLTEKCLYHVNKQSLAERRLVRLNVHLGCFKNEMVLIDFFFRCFIFLLCFVLFLLMMFLTMKSKTNKKNRLHDENG